MVEETTKQPERWEKHRMHFFLVRKKWTLYVLLRESRYLWPTSWSNERVLQHCTIIFVQSSAARALRLWHVLKENCGANIWNLKSCIGLSLCMPWRVIEPILRRRQQ